jgi:hypothetical protein
MITDIAITAMGVLAVLKNNLSMLRTMKKQ